MITKSDTEIEILSQSERWYIALSALIPPALLKRCEAEFDASKIKSHPAGNVTGLPPVYDEIAGAYKPQIDRLLQDTDHFRCKIGIQVFHYQINDQGQPQLYNGAPDYLEYLLNHLGLRKNFMHFPADRPLEQSFRGGILVSDSASLIQWGAAHKMNALFVSHDGSENSEAATLTAKGGALTCLQSIADARRARIEAESAEVWRKFNAPTATSIITAPIRLPFRAAAALLDGVVTLSLKVYDRRTQTSTPPPETVDHNLS